MAPCYDGREYTLQDVVLTNDAPLDLCQEAAFGTGERCQ
jgi:hypothetical protein